MAIGTILTQFLNRTSLNTTPKKNLPMFNTSITTVGGNITTSTILTQRKKELMKWYKFKSGLVTGLANKVVKKINSKVYWEPVNGKDGRNKIIKSQDYYDRNNLRNMFYSLLIDCIVTGESYIVKRDMDKTSLKTQISSRLENKGLPDTPLIRDMYYKANFPDETDLSAMSLLQVPSTTMENIYDMYEIKGYIQRVAMHEKRYTPDEIIHIKLSSVDGMPEGFTSLNALLTQLELDYFMWLNMKGISMNSGQPDKLYSIEDVDVNSPAFKRIEMELQKYHGPVVNRHGSLLLNGKVTVTDLQQMDSMQFENMGIYIAGLLALQWDIPRSSIPFMSKDANTKEDTGGNSERDFDTSIEYAQDTFDDYINKQIFIPKFGTRMKRYKGYKHDQMVETQTQQMRLNNLTFINDELGRVDKVLKPEYIVRYVNGINEEIGEEDLEKKPDEPVMIEGQMRQGLETNDNIEDNSDKKNVRAKKKQEQDNIAKKKGSKPTGMGKENFNQYPFTLN